MKKKNKLYIEATSLYEKGYIDKALEKCEEGIAEDMKNSVILNLKGLLLYLKGDLNGAVTVWKINSDFNDDTTAKNYIKDSKEDEKRLVLYKNAEKLIRDIHIDEAINKCRENFNNIKIIDKSISGEVAIFSECTSEAYVEKFIENMKNEDDYEEAKKLIVA